MIKDLQVYLIDCLIQKISTVENKELVGDNEYNADLFLNDVSFAYNTIPFLAGFGSAKAVQPRVRLEHRTVKRGIYEDCCKKPCSYQVLLSYCA